MKPDYILNFLGLAARGRHVASGEFQTEKAIKSRKARLVLIAEDASENTKKKFVNSCSYYHVPYRIYGTAESLGHAIGYGMRAVLALTDDGMAHAMTVKIDAAHTTE